MTEQESVWLARCPLFAGMDRTEREQALGFFNAVTREYHRGDTVHSVGMPMSRFGLVLCGAVQVYTDDVDGNRMMMAGVGEGGTFGESLCFLSVPDPGLYAVTDRETRVLWLDPSRLWLEKTEVAHMLSRRFATMLAERTLHLNDRIQVLSRKTLREKLTAYFTGLARHVGGRTFTVPLSREQMAAYLGTDRSALSRELSRLQKAGVLTYHGHVFHLLP